MSIFSHSPLECLVLASKAPFWSAMLSLKTSTVNGTVQSTCKRRKKKRTAFLVQLFSDRLDLLMYPPQTLALAASPVTAFNSLPQYLLWTTGLFCCWHVAPEAEISGQDWRICLIPRARVSNIYSIGTLNSYEILGALRVNFGHIGTGNITQGKRRCIRADCVLNTAETLLLADANRIAKTSKENCSGGPTYCTDIDLLLIGQMVVIGWDEVECGEATANSCQPLETSHWGPICVTR